MEALINFLSIILKWLLDLLLWIPRKVFEWATDGLAYVVGELLPIPGVELFNQTMQTLAPGTLWFLDLTAAGFGLSGITFALGSRFLLKLIPTLGF